MLKVFKNWKFMLILLSVCIFMSLYGFIYRESVKPPSEGWSNTVLIDEFESDHKLKTPDNRTSLAVSNGDDVLFIKAKESGVEIKTFDDVGQLVKTTYNDFNMSVTGLNGEYRSGVLYLTAVSKDQNSVSFMELDPKSYEIVARRSYDVVFESFTVKARSAVVYTDNKVVLLTDKISEEIRLEHEVVFADALMEGHIAYLAVLMNDSGTDKFEIMALANGKHTVLGAESILTKSTTNPVSMQIIQRPDDMLAVISMYDSKMGSTSMRMLGFDDDGMSTLSQSIDLPSYNCIPYYIAEEDAFLIGLYGTNMGRTEVARGGTAYPNYYKTRDFTGNSYTQVTNTERIGRTPSQFKLGDYEYLIHTEYTLNTAHVYMTSTNPAVIDIARAYDNSKGLDVFIRTIVNYPAILFSSILPTVSILLPVLAIGLPFLMLKLSWVEQNKSKTAVLMILLYTASKLYVYATDIFSSFSAANLLPDYLASSAGHWSALTGLSILTALIAISRNQQVQHKNESFMKGLAFYMLLDIVAINLFFIPYTLI